MTVEYEGKEYYAEKEEGTASCNGCMFNQADVADHLWCTCKDDKMKQDCYSAKIVWKEVSAPMLNKTKDEEPEFTVEQVLLAVGKHLKEEGPVFSGFNETIPAAVTWIKQHLAQQQDPEYQLYVKLKQKYKQVC